jgi:Fe-S cluster biosynthesis and repair protein YggX
MTRIVHCVKLGRDAEGLAFAPWPGELGKRIYEQVSKEAWAAWLTHQTMLINENRLNPLVDMGMVKVLEEGEDAPAPEWPPQGSAIGVPDGERRHGSTGQMFEAREGRWVRVEE